MYTEYMYENSLVIPYIIKRKFQKKWVYKWFPVGLWFNTCFKGMILTQKSIHQSSTWLFTPVALANYFEIRGVLGKVEKFGTVLIKSTVSTLLFLSARGWLARGPGRPASLALWRLCAELSEKHTFRRKSAVRTDWPPASWAWPWSSFFS